ncbi:response regulator [Dyadobacter sediminis]|uniref:Response regulator n=1 Tax=Dyadobacter sediminis TaxID=1493691 RepID=A0A5R9KEY8_9BACT|nr:response regulator [Dyadobacter sediminis]TLU94679.1 response regulator [Dyadobacter sediminis]GGB89090.1 response regulator [Dyadobacter sediminis]
MEEKELKIILVDDDKIMLFLNEMFLRKTGVLHDTVLFHNGKEALSYLDSYEPENTVFLILLDINMPVMNGWDFLNAIQERPYLQRLWIVMVSSATELSEKEKALSFDRVIGYQQKPLTLQGCLEITSAEPVKAFFDNKK